MRSSLHWKKTIRHAVNLANIVKRHPTTNNVTPRGRGVPRKRESCNKPLLYDPRCAGMTLLPDGLRVGYGFLIATENSFPRVYFL